MLAASALPVLLGVACYANTLRNGFVWDDPVIVERQLSAFTSWRALVVPPVDLEFASTYYRPLVFVTYLFDNWFGGGAAWAFHATPLVAHALVAWLVFVLGVRLGIGVRAAVMGSALFAVHPIHTESVAWIAGRSDVLAALCLLPALMVLRMNRARRLVIAAVLVLGALLSKETAVCAAVLLPIAGVVMSRVPARQRWQDWITVGLAVVVYAALRVDAGAVTPREPAHMPEVAWLLAFVGLYMTKLVMPYNLNLLITSAQPLWLYTTLSLAVVVGVIWYLVRGRPDPAARFLLAWVGLTLVPALLPIVWRVPAAPFAERYLYLPSIGFCLLVAHWATRWSAAGARRTLIVTVATALVVVVGAAGTVRRNQTWHNDLSLWSATAARDPDLWLPRFELAKASDAAGQPAVAERAYREALARADATGVPLILNNLGSLYMHTGRNEDAEPLLRQAVAAKADYPDPLYNLGVLYWNRGKSALDRGDGRGAGDALANARQFLEAALQVSPRLTPAHYALGSLGLMTNDLALAREHLEMTIRLAPTSREAEFARPLLNRLAVRP